MARKKRETQSEKLARIALMIEAEEAREAGMLGYMGRVLTQATMPHSDPKDSEFERHNGAITVSMVTRKKIGLPYGRLPRLLLAWVTTEAVKTKEPHLLLGASLSQFMGELGLVPTGGRWGSITRLRDQMRRLFATTISCTVDASQLGEYADVGYRLSEDLRLWWDPQEPEQAGLWQSYVKLSEPFFASITERPIPVDLRALRALRSPLALDLYCWLTYRLSYLTKTKEIPWKALEMQFGADYGATRKFRYEALKKLKAVLAVYPDARVSEGDVGLILKPSDTHIPKLSQ